MYRQIRTTHFSSQFRLVLCRSSPFKDIRTYSHKTVVTPLLKPLFYKGKGGFTVSKWASNSNAVLESVLEKQHVIGFPLKSHQDGTVKTQGSVWNPSTDYFRYKVKVPLAKTNPTKRIVLSEVVTLFDPLGLLAPLIISAKNFLQALWAEGVG